MKQDHQRGRGAEQARARERFDRTWIALEPSGAVDALGGAEYRRVWNEWRAADFKPLLTPFIRARANAGPEG